MDSETKTRMRESLDDRSHVRAVGLLLAFLSLAFACGDPTRENLPPCTPGQSGNDASKTDCIPTSESERDAQFLEMLKSLEAIGYLRGSRNSSKSGVVLHDRELAEQGLNLYTSGHAPEAILVDMDGEVIHRWHYAFESSAIPGDTRNTNSKWWRRAAIFENGDLLAIYEGMGLVKIDKDSNLIWASALKAHHDLEVQPNGDIYVLTRKAHLVPRIDPEVPILEDFISILSPAGKLKAQMSLLEAFEKSRFAPLVRKELMSGNGDLFHTNSLEVLDGRFAARDRSFEQGNILTSMNRMGVVAIVSVRLGQVVWVRRTAPIGQHDPKFLPNGNMLVFTNNMTASEGIMGSSAVEEFDPKKREPRWAYHGTEEHPFYSRYLGTASRMANGNTLITESDGGRAFEVRPNGEKVWEFFNPHREGEAGEFIATLPEMIRLPADYPVGWANGGVVPNH